MRQIIDMNHKSDDKARKYIGLPVVVILIKFYE